MKRHVNKWQTYLLNVLFMSMFSGTVSNFAHSATKAAVSSTKTSPSLLMQFKGNNPSLPWLYDQEIIKKRDLIMGTHQMALESWWKAQLESLYLTDRSTNQIIIRPRINTKFITHFFKDLYAFIELELLTGSGSIQEIFQRVGEINGIRHRDMFFLWSARDRFSVQIGAINQKFLNAPLLMANNPFLSAVESIKPFSKFDSIDLSLQLQQAIPNTFSDTNSIYTQGITKIPLFLTGSLKLQYRPKTVFDVAAFGTVFYFQSLPNNVANVSILYGNTPAEGDISEFKYQYIGYYVGVEPVIRLFPTMKMRFKFHYIRNLKVEDDARAHGLMFGVYGHFDLTENLRLTPSFEFFINQPDSSVAYYNSERYGHNDRKGAAAELTLNLYDKNIEMGLRYMNSNSVRTQATIQEQDYISFFFRTNYAKI